MRTTYAASKDEAHREHFWPGTTREARALKMTLAPTVCVHIGQYTAAFASFEPAVDFGSIVTVGMFISSDSY
jgi:hypothetical protein